jgi:hypothetical protein
LWNVENVQDPVCGTVLPWEAVQWFGCQSYKQKWHYLRQRQNTSLCLKRCESYYPCDGFWRKIGETLGLYEAIGAKIHSTVFEDNAGALSLATAPKMTPRTKHKAVTYHHFRTHVGKEKGIEITKIETDLQKADILTKGLPAVKFGELRKLLMGW